jgi:hypothetical protein
MTSRRPPRMQKLPESESSGSWPRSSPKRPTHCDRRMPPTLLAGLAVDPRFSLRRDVTGLSACAIVQRRFEACGEPLLPAFCRQAVRMIAANHGVLTIPTLPNRGPSPAASTPGAHAEDDSHLHADVQKEQPQKIWAICPPYPDFHNPHGY